MIASISRGAVAIGFFLLFIGNAIGQQRESSSVVSAAAASIPTDSLPITSGDLVTVHLFENPELDQTHLRVTDAGEIPLVLLGSIKIAGLTPAGAAAIIADAYMEHKFVRNAHALVTVEEYSSSTVSVFGYVNGLNGLAAVAGSTGGTFPLTTPRPLLTILSMAGGLSDRASHTVTIQRRDLSIKPFSVVVPNDPIASLANNPLIYPGDIVVVPRAGIVYVLGDVGSAKGVVMQEDGGITLMQALSQAGSTLPNAKLSKLMIFRKSDGQYQSIQINFGKMANGKIPDVALKAEDVVWVPFSIGKNLLVNAASIVSALSSATATGFIYK